MEILCRYICGYIMLNDVFYLLYCNKRQVNVIEYICTQYFRFDDIIKADIV